MYLMVIIEKYEIYCYCTQFYHVMFGLKKTMQSPVNISLSLSDAATANFIHQTIPRNITRLELFLMDPQNLIDSALAL